MKLLISHATFNLDRSKTLEQKEEEKKKKHAKSMEMSKKIYTTYLR